VRLCSGLRAQGASRSMDQSDPQRL
jgi:hypothetical protein